MHLSQIIFGLEILLVHVPTSLTKQPTMVFNFNTLSNSTFFLLVILTQSVLLNYHSYDIVLLNIKNLWHCNFIYANLIIIIYKLNPCKLIRTEHISLKDKKNRNSLYNGHNYILSHAYFVNISTQKYATSYACIKRP